MSFGNQPIGSGVSQPDILVRLSTIKPNHGNYRKAQDAIAEIKKNRENDTLKNKRIMELEAQIADLRVYIRELETIRGTSKAA